MANDNNNLKELVSDDLDRTADLEIPVLRESDAVYDADQAVEHDFEGMQFDPDIAPIRNRDAVIQDLKADLRIKTETIDRLQFDVERLRSRRIGLETEVKARETQTRKLAKAVEEANEQIDTLTSALHEAKKSYDEVAGRLHSTRGKHEEELRILRFELTEAAETVSQQELINEQLATDLVDTRGFKNELERMLTSSEKHSESRISQLEVQLGQLNKLNADYELELATKNEAIADLLAQMSGKTRQDESMRELEAAIEELDERVSERLEAPPALDKDRMSRVLIGKIDEQELRFPLFKKRLTIGRTQSNDIQLQAPHISRRHAVVMTEGDVTRVIDWGSKNGVYVNSSRVTEHFLASGDVVKIGDAKFRYEERPKRDS
ncbi:MAG: FHA domain-containing protein [Gammaproteobacteria bacterium]|jgi:archaellum component FlaC|nr:FHA domain-containing protein [Gammaproteobacteria bacterium]